MKILHITLDHSFRGGAEIYLNKLNDEFAVLGAEAVVFDLKPYDCDDGYDLNRLRELLAVAERFRPDVVHCHLYWADLIGAMIAPLVGCPMVSTKYSVASEQTSLATVTPGAADTPNSRSVWRTFRTLPSERRLADHFDLILTASDAVARSYEGLGFDPRKLTTVPTCHLADSEIRALYARRAARRPAGGAPTRILALARLEAEKGIADLLRAVARCRAAGALDECLVLGDGSLRASLEDLTRKLRLEDVVVFGGKRPHEECLRAITECDAVVIPSRSEAFPLVAQEALAAGCPVAGTDCGGLSEIVGDAAAERLVPPGDTHALAAAICDVLKPDRAERWQRPDAHARALREFTIRRSAEDTLAAYAFLPRR